MEGKVRPSALAVETYRTQPSGMESEIGALWGWFVKRQLGYDLRMLSSGPPDDNPVSQGWEHVSVSRSDGKMLTWDDMMLVKGLFWDDEETVVQFHPKKSAYVKTHPTCLHLWKKGEHELPPKEFIG
jgi:hypothetical protein